MNVSTQLETHGFGLETAQKLCGIETINEPDANWPVFKDCQLCYGNPRCTGFSCITSNAGSDTHGPWAKQTRDIWELCQYAVGNYPIIIWESVQQAYSVGKPLLDTLVRDIFKPNNYRVAHIHMSAASMGNQQHRKRYFFVAYRDDKNFNIEPPDIPKWKPTVYNAIWDLKDRETWETPMNTHDYDFDAYARLTPDEKACLPYLPNGWCINRLARHEFYNLPKKYQFKWTYRTSDMPFSMHGPSRLNWSKPFPTIHSSAMRFIHPEHNRPVTVGELATAMGWPDIPVGPNPNQQIAKGVCPGAGEWLARQAELYLDDAWGSEDWESRYNHTTGMWEGRNTTGETEKVFNLTSYVSDSFDPNMKVEPYHAKYRHNFYPDSQELVHPWEYVSKSRREHP